MIYLVFNPSQDYEFLHEGTKNAISNLQHNFVEADSFDEAILKRVQEGENNDEESLKEYFCIQVVGTNCKTISEGFIKKLRETKKKQEEDFILEKERQEYERLSKKFNGKNK